MCETLGLGPRDGPQQCIHENFTVEWPKYFFFHVFAEKAGCKPLWRKGWLPRHCMALGQRELASIMARPLNTLHLMGSQKLRRLGPG